LKPGSDDPLREDEALDAMVPDNPNKPYDIKEVIRTIVDDGRFLEVHEHWARNVVVGFARLGGHSVGIVANQPMVLAGVLDMEASQKAARFVRFCDAFNVPLIVFEDVPGFMPGSPGARRHHPPRRQAALRLLRGDRAQAHGDRAQGVWRRLLRDEPAPHRRRPGAGLAERRDRRDGAGRRGQRHLPPRDRRGGDPARARPSWCRITATASPIPTSPPLPASSTT
jgi:hypothetical protein